MGQRYCSAKKVAYQKRVWGVGFPGELRFLIGCPGALAFDGQQQVAVWQGPGTRPPAGVIRVGGLRRPGARAAVACGAPAPWAAAGG